MEILRLTDVSSPYFPILCEWNFQWWGVPAHKTREMVECFMAHSLCDGERLPQTIIAVEDGCPKGMYQLSMSDDLEGRPDIYPWLVNVYVAPAYRNQGVCRRLMESVPAFARTVGLKRLFLYTGHVGLYEKFGWQFVEFVQTFHPQSPLERLYKLEVASGEPHRT